MTRVPTAIVGAIIAGAVALGIVWSITAVRNTSFTAAISQPGFWLVEGATIVLTAVALLSQGTGPAGPDGAPAGGTTTVLTHIGWTAAGAVTIGVLLAVATDTGIATLLTSIRFLVPATIAIAIAALEAWPDQRDG